MYKALLFLFLVNPVVLSAQEEDAFKFIDGKKLTILGQAGNVNEGGFFRIDSADLPQLTTSVQRLARNPSGINLMFQTNSKSILVRWTLEEYKVLWNMTPLAVNGLDLYGWNETEWQYIASAKPTDTKNFWTFIDNLEGKMRHYRIYLPLYTGLKDIEVGIEENFTIKAADTAYLPSKKVVIYGSSITQGASASRPGLAYPAIISRNIDVETLNLGFSGSGKMEIEMAGVLGAMDADLYILDCVPNPSPNQIEERTVPFVSKLRELKPGIPIIMVESIFREKGFWNATAKQRVVAQNANFYDAYTQLMDAGFENLYYIPCDELLQKDHGYTADGTHLTDVGFAELANTISQSINTILKKETD